MNLPQILLSTEVQHPEFLEAESLMAALDSYSKQFEFALAQSRPADAIAASGAGQAIQALLAVAYGVGNGNPTSDTETSLEDLLRGQETATEGNLTQPETGLFITGLDQEVYDPVAQDRMNADCWEDLTKTIK